MPTIVISNKFPEGKNIKRCLIEDFGFKRTGDFFDKEPVYKLDEIKLVEINEDPVFANYLDIFETDYFVFGTRHESKSGMPCLTTHTPGNLSKDISLGGKPRQVCISLPRRMKLAIRELFNATQNNKKLKKYSVVYEPIHHGPYVSKPCYFIEVGSSENEWKDKVACNAVANSIIKSIRLENKEEVGLCIGGPHYSKKITEYSLNSNLSLYHAIPKYALSKIDKEIIEQIIERTNPRPKIFLLDWKGLGKDKMKILSILEDLELNFIKLKNLKK